MVGGHWAVLQGVAWTQMLWDYSREASFQQALQMTFSGEAPCDLCESISEKRAEEQGAPDRILYQKSGDLFFVKAQEWYHPRLWRDEGYLEGLARKWTIRSQAPPVPVPISVQALA